MQVFKFGGASIKNAQAIQNIKLILNEYSAQKLLIVVSAMGKTTNALEEILHIEIKQARENAIEKLYCFHKEIIEELFGEKKKSAELIDSIFSSLRSTLNDATIAKNHNQFYDAVVSHGEMLSSRIIFAYLKHSNLSCTLLDARDYICTDATYRDANVDWTLTKKKIQTDIPRLLDAGFVITQGFIGCNDKGTPTTLGREGSDFSAAIFASCLNAEKLTIWKDVAGILSADPKIHQEAKKFDQISYYEAAEMTFYGASVIHPKTIKPLANNKIPLFVKSFENPALPGTTIDENENEDLMPSIIYKPGQTLISFGVRDFSFITGANLSTILHYLTKYNVKINLLQNSAISLTICVDSESVDTSKMLEMLGKDFEIRYNTNLQLITVKNFDNHTIEKVIKEIKNEIYLEQKTRNNFRVVVDD